MIPCPYLILHVKLQNTSFSCCEAEHLYKSWRKTPRKRATKREVAREYRVSLRTVDTWIAEKKIPFMKLSPPLGRFDLDAVERPLARYLIKEIS